MSDATLNHLLPIVVRNPELHARWLNTCSFLEYIGFRKIVKSQSAETMNLQILQHAAEESRHAITLKRLALQAGGANFDHYAPSTLLAGEAAEAYFQGLDRACANRIAAAFPASEATSITYLYVTWLIEERAVGVYGAYRDALRAAGREAPLQGLLNEEAQHLAQVKQALADKDPEFATRSRELSKLEDALYRHFLHALTEVIAPPSAKTADATLH